MKKPAILMALAILILGSGFIMTKYFRSSKESEIPVIPTPTASLPTISESVRVSLTAKNNNRAVELNIKGLNGDVVSVEYELTYMTGAGLPRGVLGKITASGESEITRDDIVLGTCSSGKCVYDQGVTAVNLALKINSSTGSSVFQKSYTL